MKGNDAVLALLQYIKDILYGIALLVLGGICITGCILGYTNIYYYPTKLLPNLTLMHGIFILAYCILMYSAIIMDIRGRNK